MAVAAISVQGFGARPYIYIYIYIYTHTHPPPSDKKSQTWSETLGISYPRRHGPGVQWNGLGSIWKALGSSCKGLGFNWNGLGSNVKALNQERAVIQNSHIFGDFEDFSEIFNISTANAQYLSKL